jgi:hypothetical protein
MEFIMSKNSRQKTERRHKREQKQKRRDAQQWQKRMLRARQSEEAPQEISTFNKAALFPPINTMLPVEPAPVLTPDQGFDPNKWKPDEEVHS